MWRLFSGKILTGALAGLLRQVSSRDVHNSVWRRVICGVLIVHLRDIYHSGVERLSKLFFWEIQRVFDLYSLLRWFLRVEHWFHGVYRSEPVVRPRPVQFCDGQEQQYPQCQHGV